MNNHKQGSIIQVQLTDQNAIISKADQINLLHAIACSKAEEAINLAKEAGLLLIEVKKSLKHGEFQEWIDMHCQFSVRQAQRYMSAALNKPVSTQELFLKNDTMSHLKPKTERSTGVWKGEKWMPERGCQYLFKDDEGSTYWITPSNHEVPQFHICKHYSGIPMSTKDFYWRYTVFAEINDPDFTHEFYVGTRFPIFGASGIEDVLRSYGLKDIRKHLLFGCKTTHRFERPLGEPDTEIQYWSDAIFSGSDLGVPPSENPCIRTPPHRHPRLLTGLKAST